MDILRNSFLSRRSGSERDEQQDSIRAPASPQGSEGRLALLDDLEEGGLASFWVSDAKGNLTYVSPRALSQLTCEPEALIGQPLASILKTDAEEGGGGSARPISFLVNSHNALTDVTVRVLPCERETWWSISARPAFDESGEFLGYRGNIRDISQSHQSHRDASRMAQYDALTGLANRHRMTARLDATLSAVKAAKRSCALFLLDLDRFKQVNDTLGHPAGDELLKQVAQRLIRIIGEQGEIGRIGGDEFQVILPDIDDRGDLGELAKRIIQMISQPYSLDGSRAIIGTSVGIAIAPYDGVEAEELVSAADLALYAAKGNGRGQFRFYTSELKEGAHRRREIEEDLRDALQKEQLSLYYQPLICAKTNRVSGFEALMRWHHPDCGMISPGEFIPISEDCGLIEELSNWALKQACLDAASWPGDLRVAVNISVPQFTDQNFESAVRAALQASELDPRRLELEITESIFMGDPESVKHSIRALKKIGIRLALDDFGTGYSSFGYLRNAPFDKIKIDQSFVRGSTADDNNNAAIVTAIVSLADALKMETVAEGVETLDELELVKQRGATLVQGYIFAKPIPQSEVMERLEAGQLEYEPIGPAKHRSDRRTMFRRIGVIHGDHRYGVVLRNLSRTGARIEGLVGVPVGTDLVVDLGEGQLAVGTVRRSEGHSIGIEFESRLVSDGADGLCTRHRVSPYALAAAGMPLAALPSGEYPLMKDGGDGSTPKSRPQFMEVSISPQDNF